MTPEERITMQLDGEPVQVAAGTTVASALLAAGRAAWQGVPPRGPLCGMGICHECRLTINGQPDVRACLVLCVPGMDVRTPNA